MIMKDPYTLPVYLHLFMESRDCVVKFFFPGELWY